MLDCYTIIRVLKNQRSGRPRADQLPEQYNVQPKWLVQPTKDFMVRGGQFVAIWDEAAGLWSTDEYDVARLVDADLDAYAEKLRETETIPVRPQYLRDNDTRSWANYREFLKKLPDNYTPLDSHIVFANTKVTREDYVSKRLPYPLEAGSTMAFDTLFQSLYDEDNLTKLCWAIGSVLTGDSKTIQKFYVLFGAPGTGKSTALNLIEKLCEGYTTTFESGELANPYNAFALSPFKGNPLVGIDHEGDLSLKRFKNSTLASIVSHDTVVINDKFEKKFSQSLNTALFIATNKPVMITDRGSGLIRRLIDIRPTGQTVSAREYLDMTNQMNFELGAIASKCIGIYQKHGRSYYDFYEPTDMLYRTNVIFNFVDDYYMEFLAEDYTTLSRAWSLYKEFCNDIGLKEHDTKIDFRSEFSTYWSEFIERTRIDGKQLRQVFKGFRRDKYNELAKEKKPELVNYDWLYLSPQPSELDKAMADRPAQQGTKLDKPKYKWENVTTKLRDIDTAKLHYFLPSESLITLDFDIKDAEGNKSMALNIEAARKFPPTYAEASKSGQGLHLHYFYDGDVSKLSRVYEPGIEILKPTGLFSIRRKLTSCNSVEIKTINTGLPIKEEVSLINKDTVATERGLRSLILRNLHKEIHSATRPSVDFIYKILDDAYENGLRYDVTDMRPMILEFAARSTNQAHYCIQTALAMKYKSEHEEHAVVEEDSGRLVFFDVEVLPNLFLICWKFADSDQVQEMINPTPLEIEELMKTRLIGYNNRRYDNHILYARYLGFSTEDLHKLSSRIIGNDKDALFREAYGISYADVYDFSTKKQSLKHWEVELNLFYDDMEIDWNEPIDESLIPTLIKYCKNDVVATEAVFNARLEDFRAREILAALSGRRVNDSTLTHTSRIVFGEDREPQKQFVYPDLSETFEGYVYDRGKSTYRGEVVGEGGYVHAEPGMYNNVVYMDVVSMHPTSIELLNLFGPYTKNYVAIKEARVAIKEGRLEAASKMFAGKLEPYLKNPTELPGLSYALKIALNIVYGFTAASFTNPFRDPRNKDNVVAKRGSLFMVDLKHALLERGCNPIHFKTDSVKIADYTPEDITFVKEFGSKYGYSFGIEGIYEKMVLINDAVLIGKWKPQDPLESAELWDAVGARFAKPYVFKTLFSKDPIVFEDLTEKRSVFKGNIHIDFGGDMEYIGRVGVFCPVLDGGGTLLYFINDKQYALSGTKGYKWLPASVVKDIGMDIIDMSYFENEVKAALSKISKFGDPTIFLGE